MSYIKPAIDKNYFRKLFLENYFTNANNYNLSSLTPSFVNGRMRLTGGVGNFNQYLTIKNLTNTDENIEIEVIFQATVIGAGGFGVAIGKRSVNTWYNASIAAHFSPIQSTAYLWDSNSATQISSKATSTVNVNDVISLKYTQLGNEVAVTVVNITQNKIVQSKMLNNLGVVKNFKIPNTSDLSLWNLGGTNDIISISVKSLSNYKPNLLCIGDSKTFGYSATSKKLRFVSNLPFGIVMANAGDGDRTIEANLAINVTKKIKAKQVLLAIGRNDLASGISTATWQSNYQNIVTQLQNEGSVVYHLLPIPETVLSDQSVLKNWIVSTYGAGNCIDPSIGWDNGTMLSSDNVHPNAIGHAFISKKIIESGLINIDSSIEALPENREIQEVNETSVNSANYIPYSSGSSFLDSELFRYLAGKYALGTSTPYNYGAGFNSFEICGANYGILTLSKIGNTRRFYISSDGVNAYFGVNNNGAFKNVFTIDVNGNVNFEETGTVQPSASAKLQVDSTTKGFLPPRMTTTQKNAIASPVAGLIVYDTTDNKHYGYNGTTWNALY